MEFWVNVVLFGSAMLSLGMVVLHGISIIKEDDNVSDPD